MECNLSIDLKFILKIQIKARNTIFYRYYKNKMTRKTIRESYKCIFTNRDYINIVYNSEQTMSFNVSKFSFVGGFSTLLNVLKACLASF